MSEAVSALQGLPQQPDKVVDCLLQEAAPLLRAWRDKPKLDELPTGRELLAGNPEFRAKVVQALVLRICRILSPAMPAPMSEAYGAVLGMISGNRVGTPTDRFENVYAMQGFVSRLLRAQTQCSQDDLQPLVRILADNADQLHWLPLPSVLLLIEREQKQRELGAQLRHALVGLEHAIRGSRYAESAPIRRLAGRIGLILSGSLLVSPLQSGPWGNAVMVWLETLDRDLAEPWNALLSHAATATQSQPSERWGKAAVTLLHAIGAPAAVGQVLHWLDHMVPDPQQPEPNADVLKGLIWAIALVSDVRTGLALGTFAERCFRKVPLVGARSIKLGNACLHALAYLPDAAGVVELTRLRGKLRYPSAARRIDWALAEVAARTGRSVEALEELAVPSFGIGDDAMVREDIDGCTVVLAIAGTQTVDIQWQDGGGKPQRSPPARLKSQHADRIKQTRRRANEIEAALAGQVGRIERLFLEQRSWSFADWRKLYADQPLIGHLSRRLIWRLTTGGTTRSAMLLPEGLVDCADRAIAAPDASATVQLWHPAQAAADEVLQWRRLLEARNVVQPFKQAHREIYVLTDAERQTDVYSNRFAGHVIRQHQFRALCQQRGWRYSLQGGWDSHNVPTRRVEHLDLNVEFWVEPANTGEMTHAGVYGFVATDQVRFVRRGTPVPLIELEPIAFSELMRDVDLFVSICSVGNDPNWVDGGRERPFGQYWQQFAFGDLNATAQTRRDVLQHLLPKLKITDRCSLSDRFLAVRGTLRNYKIHLGSSNIMMEPNDQYLCIVPGRGGSVSGTAKLYLPFEGDSTLSVILSKAFLLADDLRITDPSILRQIKG